MKSAEVKIKGLESVKRTLKGLDDAVFEDVTLKLRGVAFRMYAEILTRSPVDTGRYRANWTPPDVSENGGVFRAVISNNLVYAQPVTFGCPVGQKPWPRAGPKTVEQAGRVYSRQAVGGVVDPVLEGWADAVVDEILGGLGK